MEKILNLFQVDPENSYPKGKLMKFFHCKALITCFSLFLLSQSATAQFFLFDGSPKDKIQLGIRFMRPNFSGKSNMSMPSGVYDFELNLPLISKLNIAVSIPFTTISTTKNGINESGIGNISLGLQYKYFAGERRSAHTSFGIMLQTAKDNLAVDFLGPYTNFYQSQKYERDAIITYANHTYYSSSPGGLLFGMEFGGTTFFWEKNPFRNMDTYLHYSLKGGFQLINVALLAEVGGLARITGKVSDFKDRFTHALAFGAQLEGSAVRPGLFYQIYLKKDLSRFIDRILGIKLEASI